MELQIKHLGGKRFSAETRGQVIISDQPESNGGEDQGMTPPELLAASLGTCAGYYAVEYLRTRSLPTDGLAIRITAEKATLPARLDKFQIAVSGLILEARHIVGLKRAVESCMVHNTLTHTPAIEVAIQCEERQSAA